MKILIRLSLVVAAFLISVCAFAGQTTVTYIHSDHLGSPIAARSDVGVTLWQEDYGPWGEQLLAPAGNKGDIGYTGHYTEQGLGLTYAQARWYDQVAGVFLSTDAVGFQIGGAWHFARYNYGYSNPYSNADPDGEAGVNIVFEGYPINTGYGFKLPLGHAGVLLINDKTGFTRYYEYGRYNPDGRGVIGEGLPQMEGNVRSVTVPNVTIGENGVPTEKSLSDVYEFLSKKVGKGHGVEAEYNKNAGFDEMQKYVNEFSNDKKREHYSIPWKTCYTFSSDVISAGEKK